MVQKGIRDKSFSTKITGLVNLVLPYNMLLALYGLKGTTVTLFDISLLLFLCLIPFSRQIKISKLSLPFIALVALIFYQSLIGFSEVALLKVCRFLLYLTSLIFLSNHFVYNDLIKNTINFAVLVSIYVVLQSYMYNQHGFNLPGHLDVQWLSLQRGELIEYSQIAPGKSWFRPRGLLGEPSQVGILVGFSLFITQKNIVKLLFVTALVLSKSGTAIILLFVWLVVTLLSHRVGRLVLVALLFLISIYLVSEIEMVFDYLIKRFLNRFTSYAELINLSSAYSLFLGHGLIGREAFATWPNSLVLFFYYYGLSGLLSLLFIFAKVVKRDKKLFFLVLLLASATELLVSQMIVFFFGMIISTYRK